MAQTTTCPECHGRKEIRDWQSGQMVDCPECDGLGVVRTDWYPSQGAQGEQPDGGTVTPARR